MTTANKVRVGNLLNLSDISDLNNSYLASPTSPAEADINLPASSSFGGITVATTPTAPIASATPITTPLNSTLSGHRVGDSGDSHLPVGKLINLSSFPEETSIHLSSVSSTSSSSSSSSSFDRSFNHDPTRGISPPPGGGEGGAERRVDAAAFRDSSRLCSADSPRSEDLLSSASISGRVSDCVANAVVLPPPPPPPPVSSSFSPSVVDTSMFDAVFDACDEDCVGRVRVSDLVKFIAGITDADEQKLERLRELQRRLDPRGNDCEIEATTFRREVVRWANDIQETPTTESAAGTGGNRDEQRRKSIRDLTQSILTSPKFNSSILGRSGVLSESVVNSPFFGGCGDTSLVAAGFGGADDDDVSGGVSGVTAEIAARDHAINSLQEENGNLKSQLEQADDMIQGLLSEKKQLSEKNKTLLQNLDKFEEAKRRAEMLAEDLKAVEEERDEEAGKKTKWEAAAAALKRELKEVNEEFGDLRRDCKAMEVEIAELEAARDKMIKEASERESVLEDLRVKLESMESDLNRVCGEKAELEADLIDAKMELTSLKSLESLSKELDEYFDDPRRGRTKRGRGGGGGGGGGGGDEVEEDDDDGGYALAGLSTLDDDFSVGMTSADCSIVASPIADAVFERRGSATATGLGMQPIRYSIHEELCGVVGKSLREDPGSEVPLLGLEKTRLSLTAAEICHGSNDDDNNDKSAAEKRAFKANLTDMADWVYECDRTGDIAGDLMGDLTVDLTCDETTGLEDSPSFFVNSAFSEIAADKIDDLKDRFVGILRRNRCLERKYFSLVKGVELLANVIVDPRNNNNDDDDKNNGDSTRTDHSRLLDLEFDAMEKSVDHRLSKQVGGTGIDDGERAAYDANGNADNVTNAATDTVNDAPSFVVVGNSGVDDTFRNCVSAFRVIRDFVEELLERSGKSRSLSSASDVGRPKPSTNFNGAPRCSSCNEPVYFAEEKIALNTKWHEACSKCTDCSKTLDSTNVTEHQDEPYCKSCYSKSYGPVGCGFGVGAGVLASDPVNSGVGESGNVGAKAYVAGPKSATSDLPLSRLPMKRSRLYASVCLALFVLFFLLWFVVVSFVAIADCAAHEGNCLLPFWIKFRPSPNPPW